METTTTTYVELCLAADREAEAKAEWYKRKEAENKRSTIVVRCCGEKARLTGPNELTCRVCHSVIGGVMESFGIGIPSKGLRVAETGTKERWE